MCTFVSQFMHSSNHILNRKLEGSYYYIYIHRYIVPLLRIQFGNLIKINRIFLQHQKYKKLNSITRQPRQRLTFVIYILKTWLGTRLYHIWFKIIHPHPHPPPHCTLYIQLVFFLYFVRKLIVVHRSTETDKAGIYMT